MDFYNTILNAHENKSFHPLPPFPKLPNPLTFIVENLFNSKSLSHQYKQDGPSLESSSNLNVTLRYLGPWDPLTLRFFALGTLGPLPYSTTSSYPLLPKGFTSDFIHEDI